MPVAKMAGASIALVSFSALACQALTPPWIAPYPPAAMCPKPAGCCCCDGLCLWDGCPPCSCPSPPPGQKQPACGPQSLLDRFEENYRNVIKTTPRDSYPSNTAKQAGRYEWKFADSWTAGFYPGLLWQIGNFTGDAAFSTAARCWTAGLEHWKSNTQTHDVGFVVFGSFGNGLLLSGENATYKDVIVQSAHSLAERYNPKVGMTRSWGRRDDDKNFEVIIDNLMNLELLLWSAAATGNTTLSDIATSHAYRTGEFWFRQDNSTAHLCVFDPHTGKLQKVCTGTPQGLAANSTWARGQAWAIYGFTMSFRYLRDQKLLSYAMAAAEYYMRQSPRDQVPLWDYDAAAPRDYKDTSAAAIVASALLEITLYTGDSKYRDEAVKILASLASEVGLRADPKISDAVLAANAHDCQDPSCTIIETDYYLYEALRRFQGAFPAEALTSPHAPAAATIV